MNGRTQRLHRWGAHLAIAAAYAAGYELTRYVSLPQWLLTAGLRLACLLLLPMRYWPALALGEGLPLIENAIFCAPTFGPAWALSASVPLVALWMGLMKPLRQRWTLYDHRGQLRLPLILAATLGCALITAASTTLTLLTALWSAPPGKWPAISASDYFWAYLLGAYLGSLTLTPVILALRERFLALQGRPLTLKMIWQSSLFQEMLCWVIPLLVALTWLALGTADDALREASRLALLWPVFGLAWRHGWHGSAFGGLGASISLALTTEGNLDPNALRVEVILALGLSGAFLIGGRAPVRFGQPSPKPAKKP